MVIRTHHETVVEPQFEYHYPYIAIDPFFLKDLRTRQQRSIEVFARTGRWALLERAIDTVWPEPTLAETFDILHLPAIISDPTRLDRTLARAADRHPAFAVEMAAATREDLRRQKASLLFRQVSGTDQRFLIALLINLPNAELILHYLATEFPGEAPAATAARLLATISATGHLPAIPEAEVANLIAVIKGQRKPAEATELSPLLKEEVLQPLFSDRTQFRPHPAMAERAHSAISAR